MAVGENGALWACRLERALPIAAKAGREDLVKLLVDFKPDLDARYGYYDRNVLNLMTEEGKIDMVEVLLKVGADVKAKDKVSLQRETLTHA